MALAANWGYHHYFSPMAWTSAQNYSSSWSSASNIDSFLLRHNIYRFAVSTVFGADQQTHRPSQELSSGTDNPEGKDRSEEKRVGLYNQPISNGIQ